jgi:hypothetical protein
MLIVLFILTCLSTALLIAGVAWTLMTSGETRRRSGSEVGAEVIGDWMADDNEQMVAQSASFKGKAEKVEKHASFSIAEIKQRVSTGDWHQVLPTLLAIGGLLGMLVFGALTAWVAIENRLIAGLIVAAACYAIVRVALAIRGA